MPEAPRHHVVITGTGRTGTTFLVQLLTHLGLDTGCTPEEVASIHPIARAGLEWNVLREPNAPYIIKSPNFTTYAEEVFARGDIRIDHVFVPMRDLRAAAESRRRVVKDTQAQAAAQGLAAPRPSQVIGGLLHTDDPAQQEIILLQMLYMLLLALSKHHIPMTVLNYPLLTQDSAYLYEKLKPLVSAIPQARFDEVFRATVRPQWVHRFTPEDK